MLEESYKRCVIIKEKINIKGNTNDKTIIRSLNHHRYGAFFKLGLDQNPDGVSDILIGGQYRYIFKPYTNQKSLSVDAKLLFNLTGKNDTIVERFAETDSVKQAEVWKDHLIMSIPIYVCYNYKSWSFFGAGFHLNIGNEGVVNDDFYDNQGSLTQFGEEMGTKEGYDYGFAVPIVKIGYNLFDKINFEYTYDLSGNSQGSLELVIIGIFKNLKNENKKAEDNSAFLFMFFYVFLILYISTHFFRLDPFIKLFT